MNRQRIEHEIRDFWQENPCGDLQVGGLGDDYVDFFDRYDRFRYEKEAHIPECLDGIDWDGRDVLEVGLGQGADAEQIVRRGARWSGLDLTREAVERTELRMNLRGLDYVDVKQGSILDAPFDDDSFDIVFSHGVLHHVPEIERAQREIARILRPGGELVVMLYAKWSLNYLVSIAVLRRLGLLGMVVLGVKGSGVYAEHLAAARSTGVLTYLKMENFIHRNTDGPGNPYSKVYDRSEVERDFPDFEVTRVYKRFLDAPPLPVTNWTGGHALGWHLWVHLRSRA